MNRLAKRVIRRAQKRLGKGAERAAHAFANGLDWVLRDPADVVDSTPYDIVHRKGKLLVRRYRPLQSELDWGIGHMRELMAVIASEDKLFEVVPGGHMGVFAGRHAAEQVWQVSADWMKRLGG